MRTTATLTCLIALAVACTGTAVAANRWHVSTYFAENLNGHGPGNRAMWCGDSSLVACHPADTVGGVANGMLDDLVWSQPAPDPGAAVAVRITCWLNHDLPDETWDFLELFVVRAGGPELLASYTGSADGVNLDVTTAVPPADFTGGAADEVTLFFRVRSDGGWSDEDCFMPSHGAAQVDDIRVLFDGAFVTFDTFEAGTAPSWQPAATAVSGARDSPPDAAAVALEAAPNPFNPRTEVAFTAPAGVQATVTVYDLLGRQVATLFEGRAAGGRQVLPWEPRALASGVYLVKVASAGEEAVRKLSLLR